MRATEPGKVSEHDLYRCSAATCTVNGCPETDRRETLIQSQWSEREQNGYF